MRSELIFSAVGHVPNRFLLTKLAATATRKFHRPNTRIQETVNQVLLRFSSLRPIAGTKTTSNVQPFRRTEKTPSRETNRTQAVA